MIVVPARHRRSHEPGCRGDTAAGSRGGKEDWLTPGWGCCNDGGAEKERKIGEATQDPLGIDADTRRAGGMIQRRGAEEERRIS